MRSKNLFSLGAAGSFGHAPLKRWAQGDALRRLFFLTTQWDRHSFGVELAGETVDYPRVDAIITVMDSNGKPAFLSYRTFD